MIADEIIKLLGGHKYLAIKKKCIIYKLDSGLKLVLPKVIDRIYYIHIYKDVTTEPTTIRIEFIKVNNTIKELYACVYVFNVSDTISVLNIFTKGFFNELTQQ